MSGVCGRGDLHGCYVMCLCGAEVAAEVKAELEAAVDVEVEPC